MCFCVKLSNKDIESSSLSHLKEKHQLLCLFQTQVITMETDLRSKSSGFLQACLRWKLVSEG